MSVGLAVSKGELDARMGDLAKNQQKIFKDATVLKSYLDSKTDPELVALGYTSQEVAVLKSAIADVNQLYNIFSGTANLAVAKDFTVFLRQLWGIGAQ